MLDLTEMEIERLIEIKGPKSVIEVIITLCHHRARYAREFLRDEKRADNFSAAAQMLGDTIYTDTFDALEPPRYRIDEESPGG